MKNIILIFIFVFTSVSYGFVDKSCGGSDGSLVLNHSNAQSSLTIEWKNGSRLVYPSSGNGTYADNEFKLTIISEEKYSSETKCVDGIGGGSIVSLQKVEISPNFPYVDMSMMKGYNPDSNSIIATLICLEEWTSSNCN